MSTDLEVVIDPDVLRLRVSEATAAENLTRLRTLAPLLVVVHAVHVVVFAAFRPDSLLDQAGSARAESWRLAIAGAHAAATVVSLSATLLMRRLGRATSDAARRFALIMAGLYLVFGALLTGIDQLVTNSINAYLAVSLGVALLTRATTVQTVAAYTLAFLVLVGVCARTQPDSAQRLSVIVNALTATALGLGLSLYANRMTRRRTHQRLLIEAQRRALTETNARLSSEVAERRRAEEELTHLATHDVLTGLPNRRAFARTLEDAMGEARAGRPSTVALLDLDHFKRINDTYGHAQGDEVLRDTARVIREALRTDDHAARLGGEEFGVLLRGTDAGDAGALLDGLRVRISELRWPVSDLRLTTSIGFTALHGEDNLDAREALRRADAALYRAKEGGRDRLVSADEPA